MSNLQSFPPLVSIIIPVFNKWELTLDCLKSLREHIHECPYEVIVVDNGSTDATKAELADTGAQLFGPRFFPVRFSENRNFGPACNAGAKHASAPILFFLNNDTRVSSGWLLPLVNTLCGRPPLLPLASPVSLQENDPFDSSFALKDAYFPEFFNDKGLPAAVGPMLLYEDDTVQHVGVAFALNSFSHLYQYFPATHPVVRRQRKVQALTGAALMVPKTLFLAHDGFFEGYVNGYEDLDLCLRMKKEKRALVCQPLSVVYHLESRTPGRMASEHDNALLFSERCHDLVEFDLHRHALADGFDVVVNDTFSFSMRLKREEEQKLDQKLDSLTTEALLELIRFNPYWVGGPRRLAEYCANAGRYDDACIILGQLAHACKQMDIYAELFANATRAGQKNIAELAQEAIKDCQRKRRDLEFQKRFWKNVFRLGERDRDRFLREYAGVNLKTLER